MLHEQFTLHGSDNRKQIPLNLNEQVGEINVIDTKKNMNIYFRDFTGKLYLVANSQQVVSAAHSKGKSKSLQVVAILCLSGSQMQFNI